MKYYVIFCHGWAGDRNFWNHLSSWFAKNSSNILGTVFLDLGYFGEPCLNLPKDLQQSENINFIGIGHSIGLIKLLSLNIKFKALIGLQSFINFLGNNSVLRKKRTIELAALKKQFNINPIDTLKNFYKLANLNVNIDKYNCLNKNRLIEDLDLLFLDFKLDQTTPLLIIGAIDDVIVPSELILDNFGNLDYVTIDMLDFGQHSVGYRNAELIYKKIIGFIDAVN